MSVTGCPPSFFLKSILKKKKKGNHFFYIIFNDLISYKEAVVNNHLNGAALLTMITNDDWKDFGVSTFGDLRILSVEVSNLLSNMK